MDSCYHKIRNSSQKHSASKILAKGALTDFYQALSRWKMFFLATCTFI